MGNKYYRYKSKYDKLKVQLGGSLLESLFVPIITCFIEYNKKQTTNNKLFGSDRFIHVKGGASIKYHMMKKGLETTGVTHDIDLFLLSTNENKQTNLTELITDLQTKIPGYTWRIEQRGELFVVFINEIQIIDITVYSSSYEEPDEDTSMFLHAIKNVGLESYKKYFDHLDGISYDDIIANSEPLDTKTFTTLAFERFSSIKGIDIYTEYISRIPVWHERLGQLRVFITKPGILDITKAHAQTDIDRLEKYTTAEYIAKLYDKLDRYIYKKNSSN